MYEDFVALKVSSDRGVVRVVLDNPPMNAVSTAMHGELSWIFTRISADADARVVVLTGATERAFCTGGDPNSLATQDTKASNWLRSMAEARKIVLSMLGCDVPIIGRINGHAIGLGATLAVSCDVTLMAEEGKIGDTHVKFGLCAGDGGSLLWPHLVGLMTAKRYLLTGDLLTAKEAADIGLMTEAVPRADLDDRVEAWVDRFLGLSPLALRTTKRALNMALRQQAESFLDAHLGYETLTFLSEDGGEAAAAMKEKRAPTFIDR